MRSPVRPPVRAASRRGVGTGTRALERGWLSAFALLLAAGAAQAQEAGSISGTVLAATDSVPVAGATVRVERTALVATTGEDGDFAIGAVPLGAQVIIVGRVDYVALSQRLMIEAGGQMPMTLYLEGASTEVDLDVERLLRESEREPRGSMNEILRPEIERAALGGLDLVDLVIRAMPSVRLRPDGAVGGETCLEYRGSAPGTACRQLALVIDGVRSQRPAVSFRTISLSSIQRIQLMSPGEAGTRFGGVGGWGVLLVETRRGPGAARASEAPTLISGFDWSQEAEPYPWASVLLATTLTNGAAVAISYGTNTCLRLSPKIQYVALRSECGSWGTVGSALLMSTLPSLSASLAARWAGGTERSRGRFGPSAVIGSAITIAGYVALMYGGARDSRAAGIAGVTVLTVGSPLFMTLADRALRELR